MEKICKLPVIYGVACYGDKKSAICYVDEKGKTHLIAKNKTKPIIKHNYFFIRGIEYLIFGLINFFSNLVQINIEQSKIAYNVSKTLNISARQIMLFCLAIIGFFVGLVLFGFLPIKLAVILSGTNYNMLTKKILVATFKVFFVYFCLMTLKLFNGFKQLYRFNACTNLDERTNSYHKPTNFLNFVVFSFLLNIIVVSLIGLTANNIFKIFANVGLTFGVFGIGYEILYASEKFNFSSFSIITSWLVTEKPGTTEKYCADCALCEVKQMNKKIEKAIEDEDLSFSVVYSEAKQKLESASVYEASDLDWLFCEVLNCTRSELRLRGKITKTQYKQIMSAVQKRQKGCPITKIFGRTEFYGLEFKVTKDVLSPRMETEILVEEILKQTTDKQEILDIGTGSGIIAICLAKFSKAKVYAIDVSDKALEVAKLNAEKNGVNVVFKNSNLFENLKKTKKFDIIVSNPPYIKTEDIEKLDKEVKNYDPVLALDGGITGLEFYHKIIEKAPEYLTDSGLIFFEVGKGQANAVAKLLSKNFKQIEIIKDYNKINRIVKAKLKGNKNVRTNRENKKKI